MKKKMIVLILTFALPLLFASAASAHVVVYPQEVTQGSYQKFSVRVPTEKDIPTIKVEVKIPVEQVSISRFEPKPDWKYEITRDGTGAIDSVIWTATGAGLSSTEFGEFHMQGKVAETAKEITWKAYQTYTDGSVVEWIGAAGSEKPASVTAVNAKAAGAQDGHGHGAASSSDHVTDANTPSDSGNTATYLSIAALILAVIALLASFRKRQK